MDTENQEILCSEEEKLSGETDGTDGTETRTDEEMPEEEKKSGFWDGVKELLRIVVFAFILAMLLRTFVVEGRVIPSGSMLPTIQLQDRVLVNKFIYRFTEPQRGDIIVFEPPLDSKDDYIKRVIGLPGDTVEVRDRKLYVNEQELYEPYTKEEFINYAFGPYTVPEGTVFVMGDNRNGSYDSHAWGPLPVENIKGKAFCMYWPIQHWKLLKWEGSFDADYRTAE